MVNTLGSTVPECDTSDSNFKRPQEIMPYCLCGSCPEALHQSDIDKMTQTLAPDSIILGDRQRPSVGDLDPSFVASVSRRLIHPIVVRRENDSTILVAG